MRVTGLFGVSWVSITPASPTSSRPPMRRWTGEGAIMRPVHPDRRLVGMARIIHVGSQSQSRWDERFFEDAHFPSWESGVEDEILRRNPNAWIQHRANVGSSPNDLTTCRPQDVDALAYEWGKEQGRRWLAGGGGAGPGPAAEPRA